MRVLIQRVRSASVTIDGQLHSSIGAGLLLLVGITADDGAEDIEYLAGKVVRLRIFDDERGVMNLDVGQAGGDIMVVSQFTLMASTRKGNRPSYIAAAPEPVSRPLYERFVAAVEALTGRRVATGVFGADMQVALVNDGPVTIWMDSRRREEPCGEERGACAERPRNALHAGVRRRRGSRNPKGDAWNAAGKCRGCWKSRECRECPPCRCEAAGRRARGTARRQTTRQQDDT